MSAVRGASDNQELAEEPYFLWEMIVPCRGTQTENKQILRVWDEKVRAIAKHGLTFRFTDQEIYAGDRMEEVMRLVRIRATGSQIRDITEMSLEYFKQDAIFCYKISDETILLVKEERP
jgi:hypothetical protein